MKPNPRARLIATAGLCLALVACGHRETRDKEGAANPDQGESPADLYVAMAAEYYRLGQLDQALRRAEQAVTEDGKNARAHYVLALIHQQLGETARAEGDFARALALAPRDSDILNAYGTFHCSQRRYPQAQAQFAKAMENRLYPTPWVALTNAGTCAASAGNLAQAQQDLTRALAANPNFGPALVKSAELDFGRGNYAGAKNYLDRYFQRNVPFPAALLLAIRTERRLGNAKTAATYEQVLRKNFPGAPELREL